MHERGITREMRFCFYNKTGIGAFLNFDRRGRQNMKYENYVFDLYGTLVDIHTVEEKTIVWEQMTAYFAEQGAVYET